jgi:hypothetical protein
MNGAGKSNAPTFVGVIYNFGKAPETSESFSRFQEAKEWCAEHAEYEDCIWVVLSDGIFESGGIIDGMWEDHGDEDDDDWFDEREEEQEPRL